MNTFKCQCGSPIHFINSKCLSCDSMLGFLPDDLQLSSLRITQDGLYQAATNDRLYRQCKNYWHHDVCNWMVPVADPNELCSSCRLNVVIPNLDKPGNMTLWYRMEQAKRRLLYTLYKLDLPLHSRQIEPETGLGFSFLEDQVADEYGNELTVKDYIVTGHNAGLITLNLNEARDSARTEMREKMNEDYRTLIGHFRHESGHYYWDKLISHSPLLERFRELFGDERICYTNALEQYYKNGPSENWQNVWISAYASMHPWEDWAETWAHYLHMVDTLETANSYQLSVGNNKVKSPLEQVSQSDADVDLGFTKLISDWWPLVKALNAMNRSMGHDDAYPFVVSITALDKMRFIHEVIHGTG